LIFSTNSVRNISRTKKNPAVHCCKCTEDFTGKKTCYFCLVLIKHEPSRQICFKNFSDTKFHENSFSGKQVACGRKDVLTDTMKLVVAFRNFAKSG